MARAARRAFRDLEILKMIVPNCGSGKDGRRWTESDGSEWQMFLFRWPKPASLFDRVILHNALSHQPEICLPATGRFCNPIWAEKTSL